MLSNFLRHLNCWNKVYLAYQITERINIMSSWGAFNFLEEVFAKLKGILTWRLTKIRIMLIIILVEQLVK